MAKLLHYAVIAACVLVVLGFACFAADEISAGSQTQQSKLADELNDPTAGAATKAKRARVHSRAREALDKANDVLLAPFTPVVESSNNIWVKRGVPTILALLAYGLLGALIANSLPKRKPHAGDWRTADSP
jgi:hypothetical protein